MTETPTVNDYGWTPEVAAETLKGFTTQLSKAVAESVQKEIAPPFYDARKVLLPLNEAVEILSYDASRVLFYLRASTADAVQMGKREQVEAGLGWTVGSAAQTEFHTVDNVYVRSTVEGSYVDLWVEYRAQ